MRYFQVIVALCLILGTSCFEEYGYNEEYLKNTADRVREHGYPGEVHYVETEDNYVIGLFRIPYSHKLNNKDDKKPAILLQHGLLSCSDAWILSGPDNSLAYLLADAGYDVWMGNARGTRYSRNNTRVSTNHPYFWRFSWHEIGAFDIAAMIDHILVKNTASDAIHYVGHSQGTTVYFVLMSFRPEYNAKIKTAHLLAPVAFMGNMKLLLAKYTRPYIGRPNKLTRAIDTMEVLSGTKFYRDLMLRFCKGNPLFTFMCSNLYLLVNGIDNSNGNMNTTVAAHIAETHPAGASSSQVLHYMQEYESGHFRQFDYGEKKNMLKYGRATPPDYDVAQITAGTYMYYCDADTLADPIDVEYIATLMPNVKEMFHVPDPTFGHGDFAFHKNVKEIINDRIVDACNKFEGTVAVP